MSFLREKRGSELSHGALTDWLTVREGVVFFAAFHWLDCYIAITSRAHCIDNFVNRLDIEP